MNAPFLFGPLKRQAVQDNVLGPEGIVAAEDLFDAIAATPDTDTHEARLHDPIEFRSIFISDAHMGTLSSCATELAQFLIHTVNAKYIYLVGDIFEEHLPKRIVTSAEELFLQKLMRAARKGARVVGLPGNHDTFMRKYAGVMRAHNFIILEEAAHRTVDGRHFLVTHGDRFDVLMRWPWLTVLGTRVYETLCRASLKLNRLRQYAWIDRVLRACGITREWSLSQHIKSQSDQMAYSTNASYIRTMTHYLFNRNAEIQRRHDHGKEEGSGPFARIFFDGLIGGHSHIADKKRFLSPLDPHTAQPIGPTEVTYFNTGHWTGRPRRGTEAENENWRSQLKNPTCTAVVEHPDGRMSHVQWVPGRGIVPLTRYEENDIGPYEPNGAVLAKAASDWKKTKPDMTLAARIGQWISA